MTQATKPNYTQAHHSHTSEPMGLSLSAPEAAVQSKTISRAIKSHAAPDYRSLVPNMRTDDLETIHNRKTEEMKDILSKIMKLVTMMPSVKRWEEQRLPTQSSPFGTVAMGIVIQSHYNDQLSKLAEVRSIIVKEIRKRKMASGNAMLETDWKPAFQRLFANVDAGEEEAVEENDDGEEEQDDDFDFTDNDSLDYLLTLTLQDLQSFLVPLETANLHVIHEHFWSQYGNGCLEFVTFASDLMESGRRDGSLSTTSILECREKAQSLHNILDRIVFMAEQLMMRMAEVDGGVFRHTRLWAASRKTMQAEQESWISVMLKGVDKVAKDVGLCDIWCRV
ncbi:hypothetical protein BJ508DRAFT_314159 [Ascobolus immersus RN42]|uniref:Uncharacterized protein n=1 Tax=Ascobolus immersus RN42 TaxID=1160509 RepID=A0A3N4HI32_ASCIM|nr:hypothetical protein BJ508DRAFT_314159 [Ascobolus immersus RN42]